MRWALGIALSTSLCMAQMIAPNSLLNDERAAGWKLLFDGRTFSGWDDPSVRKPAGDAWRIESGWIKSKAAPRIREDLVSVATFENFELDFEWRVAEGGNSGVKYRIQDRFPMDSAKTQQFAKFEDKAEYEIRHRVSRRDSITPGARFEEYLVAFEYQTIDDVRHADAKKGPDRTSGALYSIFAPPKPTARPAGQVNQSRIVLRGNHVEHWLNGAKVVDARLDDPEIGRQLAKRWTTKSRIYELLTTQPKKRTPIALQHHNDEVWFRSIKIRELP